LRSTHAFLGEYIRNENIKQMGNVKASGDGMFSGRKRCISTWRSPVDYKLALCVSG